MSRNASPRSPLSLSLSLPSLTPNAPHSKNQRIFKGSNLVLSADDLEFSQPTPSACVLANLKRTIPLENITDVTVEDDCLLQMFNLKKILVQTAGTGGIPVGPGGNTMAGIQAVFVKVGLFFCFPLLLPSRPGNTCPDRTLAFLTITRSRSSGSLPSITHTRSRYS